MAIRKPVKNETRRLKKNQQRGLKDDPGPVPAPPAIPTFTMYFPEKGYTRVPGEPKSYMKFEASLDHWGLMRSFRVGIRKDGKDAYDVILYDMGVKLYEPMGSPAKIVLGIQAHDRSGEDTLDHAYELNIDFEFMGQELGIAWNPVSIPENPRNRR